MKLNSNMIVITVVAVAIYGSVCQYIFLSVCVIFCVRVRVRVRDILKTTDYAMQFLCECMSVSV